MIPEFPAPPALPAAADDRAAAGDRAAAASRRIPKRAVALRPGRRTPAPSLLRAGEGPDDTQNSEEQLRQIYDRRHPRAKRAPS